jgi:MFS superfamily sulfate permease-like transporter
MTIVHAACTLLVTDSRSWSADWAWGLPLIVLTVVIHVLGLGTISHKATRASEGIFERRHPTIVFVTVVGTTTLLATCLHGLEAGLWASAYRGLGALPDFKSSMLYSLNAMTSYGHTDLELPSHWHLMGAMEALNGWLLFGLTAAFLFAVIDKVWSQSGRAGRR